MLALRCTATDMSCMDVDAGLESIYDGCVITEFTPEMTRMQYNQQRNG